MQGMGFIVIYIVFFAALIYFTSIRPQKKERQKQQEMLSSVAVGDTILTTSGFYGVIIDMTDDTVIVEFGSNKNCRIPMQKAAIVQVEKPETKQDWFFTKKMNIKNVGGLKPGSRSAQVRTSGIFA